MALSWVTERRNHAAAASRCEGTDHSMPPGHLTILLSSYIPGGGQSPPRIYLGFVLAQGNREPGDARSTDRSLRVSGCFQQLLFVL